MTINPIKPPVQTSWNLFMPPTFYKFAILIALLLIFSSPSTTGYAQCGQLPYAEQVCVSDGYAASDFQWEQNAYDDDYVSNGSYQPVIADDSVDQLYRANSRGPLKGLFARGFTRTLTVLGGWNFLNSIGDDRFILDPLSNFAPLPRPSGLIESETGYAISFAFGRRHSHRLRSEIELAIRENDASISPGLRSLGDAFGLLPSPDDNDDKIRAYSVMKNFIVDLRTIGRFTPYVGAGLGWSYLELEAPSLGGKEGTGAFSYQAIGGVATTLNKATDFIVEYRFLGTSEVEVDGVFDPIAFNAHNLFMGLKFEY